MEMTEKKTQRIQKEMARMEESLIAIMQEKQQLANKTIEELKMLKKKVDEEV